MPVDSYATPKDLINSKQGRIGLHGDQRFAQRYCLVADEFETGTLDTTRWTAVTANGGSVTPSNGVLTLTTSANAAGQAGLDSVTRLAPIMGTELYGRWVARYGTDSDTDNTRWLGFRNPDDPTTQMYFELDDSTLAIKVDDAGSTEESDTTITPFAPDDNYYWLLEIFYSKWEVRFAVNGAEVGSWNMAGANRTTPFMSSNVFCAFAENLNSGSTTSNTFTLTEMSAYLLGDIAHGPTAHTVSRDATSDAQLCRGPGILERWETDGGANQTWDLRDGTTATDRLITGRGSGYPQAGQGPWYFAEGLYFNHTAGLSSDESYFYVRG